MEGIFLKTKYLLLPVALLVLSLLFFGCITGSTPAGMVKVQVSITDDTNAVIFSKTTEVNQGLNAFDALKQVVGEQNIGYQSYDFGVFVSSFMGKNAPQGYFWALSVNGRKAESGISAYSVDHDTNLDWSLEKISN